MERFLRNSAWSRATSGRTARYEQALIGCALLSVLKGITTTACGSICESTISILRPKCPRPKCKCSLLPIKVQTAPVHLPRLSPSSHTLAQVSLDSGDISVLMDGPAAAIPSCASPGVVEGITTRSSVAVSPIDSDTFLTGASGGFLRKWSSRGRRLVAKLALGSSSPEAGKDNVGEAAPISGVSQNGSGKIAQPLPGIGAVGWASGGGFVVCGLSTGDVILVSPDDMKVLSRYVLPLNLGF